MAADRGVSGGSSNWLSGLPRVAVEVIKDLAPNTATHQPDSANRWSLRRQPTTGRPRDCELILRAHDGRVLYVLPVMAGGALLAPFDGSGERPVIGPRPASGRRYRPDLQQGLGVVGGRAGAH